MKVASGEIMGGATHEATIGIGFWEHDRLNRRDLAKGVVFSGNFYAADIFHWDIIMGYDFLMSKCDWSSPSPCNVGSRGQGASYLAIYRPCPRIFSVHRR